MGNLMDMIYHVHYTKPSEVDRPWCGPYVSFCMFSGARANDLPEAQAQCGRFTKKSWPIELADNFSLASLIDYSRINSISNVILNANKQGDSWFWISSNMRVENFENIDAEESVLVHDKIASHNMNYSVVCMLECRHLWNEFSDTKMNSTAIRNYIDISAFTDCKDACRKNSECSSIDVETTRSKVSHCWLYPYPYDESLLYRAPNVTHLSINRSSKTIERCFSDFHVGTKIYLQSLMFFVIAGIIALLAAFLILSLFCVTLTLPNSTGSTAS